MSALVAGNWKMNLTSEDIDRFTQKLRADPNARRTRSLIFPPFPYLERVVAGVAGTAVEVGGQDLHPAATGSFTGDVAGTQLADVGCRWALCGHSERRAGHGETDAAVLEKVQRALQSGLTPLVCIGESLGEREAGTTNQVLEQQIANSLPTSWPLATLTVAYEPVWAIGTGKTATPEVAQEAHSSIRRALRERFPDLGELILLYGGSAKPSNCTDLVSQDDVDGLLVGGASLDPDSFLDMIRRCAASAGAPEETT